MNVNKKKSGEKFFFMYKKSYKISNLMNIDFIILKNLMRFLVLINNLGVKRYIKVPVSLSVVKKNQIIFFKYNNKNLDVLIFLKNFFKIYRELTYKIFEIIKIRGVGLKIMLKNLSKKFLELKLGYSHKILVMVPKSLNVIIKKKKILIEGLDKVSVGNFVRKVINFKPLNIYTGKGLWVKSYNKLVLKEIKKI